MRRGRRELCLSVVELCLMQLLSFFRVRREAGGSRSAQSSHPVEAMLLPFPSTHVCTFQLQLNSEACFYHFSRRGRLFCDFHRSGHSVSSFSLEVFILYLEVLQAKLLSVAAITLLYHWSGWSLPTVSDFVQSTSPFVTDVQGLAVSGLPQRDVLPPASQLLVS